MAKFQKTTKPLSDATSAEEAPRSFTRRVKTVIVNGKFHSEALSWQGYDLALLELEPEDWKTNSKIPTVVAPACLPYKGFMKNHILQGYGHHMNIKHKEFNTNQT